jgi:lipid kinase YegS
MRRLFLILNGKAADREDIAEAISILRSEGTSLEVQRTHGDGHGTELARAGAARADVVVAVGGDGTLHEVAAGLLGAPGEAVMALVPAGTANDFARGCGIPLTPLEALRLAQAGAPRVIDVLRVNERYTVNVATAAFTGDEPVELSSELKRALGGVAYWVAGFLRSLQLEPKPLRWLSPDGRSEDHILLLTAANGRQTGGGAVVAEGALLDDGLMDIRLVRDFPVFDLPLLIAELADPLDDPSGYIGRYRLPWFEVEAQEPWKLSLDGEPMEASRVRFEVEPKALRIVLPPGAPLAGPLG